MDHAELTTDFEAQKGAPHQVGLEGLSLCFPLRSSSRGTREAVSSPRSF